MLLNYIRKNYLIKNVKHPYKFIMFNRIGSTNDYAKQNKDKFKGDFVVIANEQTSGRGRKGKSFYSPKNKGLYFSVCIKKQIPKDMLNFVTTYTVVKVLNAIEKLFDVKLCIKWVNDIYLNGKKLCGILTEMVSEKENVIVIGIGINFKKANFPESIKNIATSLGNETKLRASKTKLISQVLNELSDFSMSDFKEEYKERSFIKGKKIIVLGAGNEYQAEVLDIDDNLALVIKKDDEIITLNSGDVSIRGLT